MRRIRPLIMLARAVIFILCGGIGLSVSFAQDVGQIKNETVDLFLDQAEALKSIVTDEDGVAPAPSEAREPADSVETFEPPLSIESLDAPGESNLPAVPDAGNTTQTADSPGIPGISLAPETQEHAGSSGTNESSETAVPPGIPAPPDATAIPEVPEIPETPETPESQQIPLPAHEDSPVEAPMSDTAKKSEKSDETEKEEKTPITVSGDAIEYSSDKKDFTVTGNAEIVFKKTRLTCDRLWMNTVTKDCRASGKARLEDKSGIIEGEEIVYNFERKYGTILDSGFRANPYFGRAERVTRVNDYFFMARRSHISTCSFDNPHWRMRSQKINIYPGNYISMRDAVMYIGPVPLLYLPQFNRSLKEPIIHVQVTPGKRKEWGAYVLSAWRYRLTDWVTGRIYFDVRQKLGTAQGFGANYKSPFGTGDFKFYYTHEKDTTLAEGVPNAFQRYLIRWRHKWTIDPQTNLISEYFKIVDSKRIILNDPTYNLLKDYFPQEYTKEAAPLSYVSLTRTFTVGTLDLLVQKRMNRWYSQEEKLPEIKFTVPSISIGGSRFYLESSHSFVNYNRKLPVPADASTDVSYNSLVTSNRISLPARVAFLSVTPFISNSETLIDRSTYGWTLTSAVTGGADVSTKFYRIFNVNTKALGLNINGLRHVITPTFGYSYGMSAGNPTSHFQLSRDESSLSNSLSIGLSNKLQTRRDKVRVDLADLRLSTSYQMKHGGTEKRSGGELADFLVELDAVPYSWMSLHLTSNYSRIERAFRDVAYDLHFTLGKDRSLDFGQRYYRKSSKEFVYTLNWRFDPKWKMRLYHRYEVGNSFGLTRGLVEQEYTVGRDLHCWSMEISYNVKRNEGETIWLIFRIKAFPEMEIDYNRSYHAPKPGSQS